MSIVSRFVSFLFSEDLRDFGMKVSNLTNVCSRQVDAPSFGVFFLTMVVSNSILIGASLEVQANERDAFSGEVSWWGMIELGPKYWANGQPNLSFQCAMSVLAHLLEGQDILLGFNTFYATVFTVEAFMRLIAQGIYGYIWASPDWVALDLHL